MSQNQPVTQPETQINQNPMLELTYRTWGSYGQFKRDIAILQNGAVIDPSRFSNIRGKVKRKINEVEVEIENNSSSRNEYIVINVPRTKVLAIIHEVRTTGNFTREIKGEGEIVQEDVNEEFVNGNKHFIITYTVTYFKSNDVKVELEREKKNVLTSLIGKPKVRMYVLKLAGMMEVKGDTYNIRDTLKHLNFRWTGATWRREYRNDDEVNEIKKVLNEVSELEVIE